MKKLFAYNRLASAVILLGVSSLSFAGEFSWTAEPGVGYDSNIYRAPSGGDYIDYGKSCSPVGGSCQVRDDGAAHPLISPKVQSGTFVDANLDGLYQMSLQPKMRLMAEYKFRGRFYTDSGFSNANQYHHNVAVGALHTLNTAGKLSDSIYAGLKFGKKKRLYLDRDSGDEQVFANEDVSGRYTYDMTGVDVQFKKRTGKIKYKLGAEFQKRDYVNEVVISEYDHDYFRVGGNVKYPFSKKTKLTLGYDYTSYDYKDRPSRNVLGKLLTSSPKRKYVYNRMGATLRHRFNRSWLTYLDYERLQRDDSYQSYDNYTKNTVKLRAHYRWDKNKLKVSVAYWKRDYPNAFAFDNFVKGISKEYDGLNTNVQWIKAYDERVTLSTGLKVNSENSTDLRYGYDRYRLSFAVSWDSK
ncbi:MAG TPA: hypothetical protein ENK04_13255 [Gammaproteobacteria bacterium]|nr:hypothetical protein [Gammaproteobacteria bacterium]